MTNLIRVLLKSLVDFFHPKSLIIFFLPFFLSALLWSGLLFFFYDQIALYADQMFNWILEKFSGAPSEGWHTGFMSLITLLVLALILPLFWITQILLSSLLAFPLVIRHVRQEYYNDIPLTHQLSQIDLIFQTLRVSAKYLVICFITLPVLLFPLVALLFWSFLGAWLFAGLYLQEVLAEVANSDEEAMQVKSQTQDQVRLAVLATSLMTSFVPGFFIVSPVYSALVISHLGLAGIKSARASKNQ